MNENWCVLVFRKTNPDFPTSILGPFNELDANEARLHLPKGFLGYPWRMETEIRP